LRNLADRELKPSFERIPGVANVEVFGGLEREVRVKVSPERLRSLLLTIDDIIHAVSRDNQNTPVGNITEGNFKYLIRSEGEFQKPEDLGNIIVKQIGQRPIYLSDVAIISDSYKDIESVARLNGKPAVNLQLKKESGANPVQISDNVKKLIPRLESRYKGRMKIAIAKDGSDFIRDSIQMVIDNATTGAILSIIVIFLFLWNVRSTIIIGTTIPMAVIITFAFMYLRPGMTLNLMTLGGLALGIGMMVDNAIVVLENIYRRMRFEGDDKRAEISVTGTEQVTLAIFASTLTTVAVFLPIGFVPGVVGEIFNNMSLAIVFSLIASYLTAVTVVPLMSSRMLRTKAEGREYIMDVFRGIYRAFLGFLLRSAWRRWAYFLLMVGLFVGSFRFFPPMEFFPKMDRGTLILKYEMPEGTSIETTDLFSLKVEEIVRRFPEVERFQCNTKMAEGNVTITLVPLEKRTKTTNQLVQLIRQEVARLPGYTDLTFAEPGMGPPDAGKPVQIEVSGDDFDVVASLCLDITERVKNVPGLKDINSGVKAGRPEVRVEFDREKLKDLGIDLAGAAGMLRSFIYGTIAGKYKERNEEFDVRVEAMERYKDQVGKLEHLDMALDDKVVVNLAQIARFRESRGFSKIERKNLKRQLKVTADIENRPLQAVILDIQKLLKDVPVPSGYEINFGGEEEERAEAFGNLNWALLASIILVYMIMAAQFESLAQAFIIMFTIPLSIIGVILALNIYGFAFSITAMIGIIMLAGIVVNNGIILIDYINQARAEGMEKIDAALESGAIRLRPVLMTVGTTVIGMFPLSLGIGAGSDFYQPLAITVIGGLIVSTFLTLTYVPVVYVMVDNLVEGLTRIVRRFI
ncbi:MAG TPA: efflux RND transporter permease subunit, partial [Candidatus Ozemobacteraceae bacterium]|nr:efflux RND transporter permease subunit [Candidatus Ozemobacteraceae bacterium]